MMSVTRFRMVILSGLKSKRRPWHLSRGSYLDYQRFEHFEKRCHRARAENNQSKKKEGVLEILGAPSGLIGPTDV